MNPVPHRAIRASAGTGKTYALVVRYLGLLAAGAAPERIVALTFTRKAAGEMLDRILERLADASDQADACAALAQDLRAAGLDHPPDAGGWRRTLRTVIEALPSLAVGTMDSFFARAARCFPLELGLCGEVSLRDEAAAEQARERLLSQVLGRQARLRAADTAAFCEAFRRATFGRDLRAVFRTLDEFVRTVFPLWLESPDGQRWGQVATIWSTPPPLTPLPDLASEAIAAVGEQIFVGLGGTARAEQCRAGWLTLLHAIRTLTPGDPMPEPKTTMARLLAMGADLAGGRAEVTYYRKSAALDPAACAVLQAARARLIGAMITGALERTRGLFTVLDAYGRAYAAQLRTTGAATFQDLPWLLDPRRADGPGPLSSLRAEDRMYVEYRLDGAYDHWLLDEFQDTSLVQWSILRGLIEEALQSSSDRPRSFFYVGDVKQAIYGWRNGEARLFNAIRDEAEAAGTPIGLDMLTRNYRSAPAVLDAVNRVFGGLDAVEGIHPGARTLWVENWDTHVAAERNADRPGMVALYQMKSASRSASSSEAEGGEEEASPAGLAGAAAALVRSLPPSAREGAAVLVRRNSTASAMVEALRAAGIHATEEGARSADDNPVIAALLAWLGLAAHPGDRLRARHAEGTPVAAAARACGWWPPTQGPGALLGALQDRGVEAVLRCVWTAGLDAALDEGDSFSRLRFDQTLGLARDADAAGECDPIAFIRRVRTCLLPPDRGMGVRVMTIHKAKGLQFDIVVAPELKIHGGSLNGAAAGRMAIHRTRPVDPEPAWILERPPREVAEQDDVLAGHLREQAAMEAYEELCGAYVAMTRARQALYLLIEPPPKSPTAFYPADLIRDRLGGAAVRETAWPGVGGEPVAVDVLYETPGGEAAVRAAWAADEPPPAVKKAATAKTPAGKPARGGRRRAAGGVAGPARVQLEERTPSGSESGVVAAAALWSRSGRRAASLGTAVHDLMQWVAGPETVLDEALAAWIAAGQAPEEVRADAEAMVRRAWVSDVVRAALTLPEPPPGGVIELWREQRFELVLDGAWVSGSFDRVTLVRDTQGRAVSAEVLDYKTDDVADPAVRAARIDAYAPQLALYRSALARLTGLPPEIISTRLLFLRDV
jgi:ATP-dependent helicase/nuclease subunit A